MPRLLAAGAMLFSPPCFPARHSCRCDSGAMPPPTLAVPLAYHQTACSMLQCTFLVQSVAL